MPKSPDDATVVGDTNTLLDTLAPTSNTTSPQYSTITTFTVSDTANDALKNGSASGLDKVEIYVRTPISSSYVLANTFQPASGANNFSYSATAGDGIYSFYSIAYDKSGNAEAAPASPDSATLVDTRAPESSATSPAYSTSTAVTIGYSAVDPLKDGSASGLARVELWARGPADSGYALSATDSSPGATGSFPFTSTVDGSYDFYTVAYDNAGNVDATTGSADTATLVDTEPPVSSAASPQYSTTTSITVQYSASDPLKDSSASGLDKVELWAKAPGGSFAKVATDSSPGLTGSFSYTASVDGSYDFYTRARDKAGNYEDAPAGADTSTLVDTRKPTSSAGAPAFSKVTTFSVSYTASDPQKDVSASGLNKVEIYVRTPGTSPYVLAHTFTAAAATGSFTYTGTVDGSYDFYSKAYDNAGNVEATPLQPDDVTVMSDSSTLLDQSPPTSTA